ncbi:hypothetical protein MXD81_31205 [Microbacteriaceae bacterium K1510]|nr:hypothetical protein [Microbacteriaceae bacterium K1510]
MHPALHSWRDDLPTLLIRLLAYLAAAALLSIAAAQYFQSKNGIAAIDPTDKRVWIDIEKPFPAFALSIPEAVDVPSGYAIRRHAEGNGRKDILTLGDADGTAPYLSVEIYRPGTEIDSFAAPENEIATNAKPLGPVNIARSDEPLGSKFGPLTVVTFATSVGTPRQCLAFVRTYADPRLQLSGWFCQGGENAGTLVDRSTLSCALDRLTLLAAGSEPKVGALFAQAELHRTYCGQRDTILAPTPKYKVLWKALETRPEPRRVGR